MPADIKGHIVTVALPAWGHTKPLCALLARHTRIRPTHATIFTSDSLRPQVVAEVNRQFADGEEGLKKLIRYRFNLLPNAGK